MAKTIKLKQIDYTDKAWTVNAGGVVYPNKMNEEKVQSVKTKVQKPKLPAMSRIPKIPKF